MKTRTAKILDAMKILSWIVFIGLLIQAGTLIFASIYISINPGSEISYLKSFDWINNHGDSHAGFYAVWILKFAIICFEAYSAMVVIKVLSAINIANPFTISVAKGLERISYLILDIWILTIISKACSALTDNKVSVGTSTDDISFIFLAGIIFVFSQIFKRGIELQSDNELTI